MNSVPNSTTSMWLDFEPLSLESVELSPEIIDKAVELSLQIPHEERQWQTYLNALALYGFEQWLESHATNYTINREQCSLLQLPTANAIDAVCNLKVNDFNVCLIATGSLTDEEVTLPRAVVDLPEFIPHFYVVVEVQEELSIATVQAFLTYEQLVNRRATVHLVPEEDWTYQVPLTWFVGDLDRLLLYLSCLEPIAIPLPAVPSNVQRDRYTSCTMQLSQISSQLQALLPQLQSSERQLWQVLTWEQGAAVLTCPELLHWLYQLQSQAGQTNIIASVQNHLSDILQLVTQRAVNAGRWLSEELDEFAQELSWVLLPSSSFIPASAMRRMRTPEEEFEAIVTQLRQTDVEIPMEARGAYRDLRLAGMPLRLYAVTWPLLSGTIPEWTLLLVLGATPGTNLPPGIQLRVSDQTGILVEQGIDAQQQDYYFYTSVIGTWDEKFIVTVSLRPGIEQKLPPFSFNPEG